MNLKEMLFTEAEGFYLRSKVFKDQSKELEAIGDKDAELEIRLFQEWSDNNFSKYLVLRDLIVKADLIDEFRKFSKTVENS